MEYKTLHKCGRGSTEIYDRTFECSQEEGEYLLFHLKATNSYYCESFPVLFCPFCGYKDQTPGAEENEKIHKPPLYDLPTHEEIKIEQSKHPGWDEELCIDWIIKDKKRL
jgi:hypothetical protein